MSAINFQAKLLKIGSSTIIRLPKDASAKLPSRGMTMVKGSCNGYDFQSELEPDGRGSHWFKVDKALSDATHVGEGDTVKLAIASTNQWPEPKIPEDVKNALSTDTKANTLWRDITPMARWDWIRWIGSTKNPETRKRHVEVALSKLRKGERRPCCFNRSLCTDPSLCTNGILPEE